MNFFQLLGGIAGAGGDVLRGYAADQSDRVKRAMEAQKLAREAATERMQQLVAEKQLAKLNQPSYQNFYYKGPKGEKLAGLVSDAGEFLDANKQRLQGAIEGWEDPKAPPHVPAGSMVADGKGGWRQVGVDLNDLRTNLLNQTTRDAQETERVKGWALATMQAGETDPARLIGAARAMHPHMDAQLVQGAIADAKMTFDNAQYRGDANARAASRLGPDALIQQFMPTGAATPGAPPAHAAPTPAAPTMPMLAKPPHASQSDWDAYQGYLRSP